MNTEPRPRISGTGADIVERHVRHPLSLPIFAFFVALGILMVSAIAPNQPVAALSAPKYDTPEQLPSQILVVNGDYAATVERDAYSAKEKPKPAPAPVVHAAPPAGKPDPGTAQAIAYEILQSRGLGDDQFSCLVSLWNRESGWNVYAANRSSGAYGIPQALPGSKMAAFGDDWQTNPRTQIMWGLSYIEGRYGTPCGAWNAFLGKGWY